MGMGSTGGFVMLRSRRGRLDLLAPAGSGALARAPRYRDFPVLALDAQLRHGRVRLGCCALTRTGGRDVLRLWSCAGSLVVARFDAVFRLYASADCPAGAAALCGPAPVAVGPWRAAQPSPFCAAGRGLSRIIGGGVFLSRG